MFPLGLSEKEKQLLQTLYIHNEFITTTIQSPYELFHLMEKQIKDAGLSNISRSSPEAANCIIRVYQKIGYDYDGSTYNLYGVICYTKGRNNKWYTGENMIPLNHSEHKIRLWLYQDDYIDLSVEYMDIYVKIN